MLDEKRVARPLDVLANLIRKDLEQGKEAAQKAGAPYYKAAGEKLHEAKASGNMSISQLTEWTKRNFDIGRAQALLYMSYADATSHLSARDEHPSLNKFRQEHHGYKQTVHPSPWREEVKSNIERARAEAKRIQDENLTRQQERDAERKMALRLIDIGFKVLAKELHPDKGGSRDAMSRLSRVRDRLKTHA
jgi:hypothetical protein